MVKKIKILENDSINLLFEKISKVLHVQNCSSNLLSINKISQELYYKIIFSSKNIFSQDQITRNVIAEGYLKNRLYILNKEK
jgi:hypothetical protein